MNAPADPLVQTFMTHRMSDAVIRALATDREQETGRIMDAVRRSLAAAPGALQHIVIYGPRGFGKSFVARLVQIETAELAAARGLPLPFVLLPEEQHNLTRNPHALPAYIAHKVADLRTGEDRSWAGAMFQWPDPEKEARQWDEAVDQLERELDLSLSAGQGMAVVVIENFDVLLANVFKEDAAEQRLRKWLDRPRNRVMLIATATGSVDMDYDRPLFQAFQSIRLEPWSQESCIHYFNRRRAAEALAPLDGAAEAKARAVADFIGGNPRLAQLLAEVLETQDALSVAATMNALADKLADYYRRRIEDLPALAQGLFDALLRGGEPASQTELAQRVGAGGQNAIARVMQDLQRADIIRGVPALDGRETLYRVTDRVFAHFYRLRQGQQLALHTPLATILDFLRAFYSRDEQRAQAMRHLNAGQPAEARIFADLAREGAPTGHGFKGYFGYFDRRLRRIASCCAEALPVPLDAILREVQEYPENIADQVHQWEPATPIAKAAAASIAAQALARMGLVDQAEARLGGAIDENPDPAARLLLQCERGSLLDHLRGDRAAAIRCWATAGATNPDELPASLGALALRCRAYALGASGQHQEAIATARQAAALAAQAGAVGAQAEALRLAAWSLGEAGQHGEAIGMARQAAALAAQAGDVREQAEALRHAAWSLGQSDQHQEAIATARQAAALAAQAGDVGAQAQALRLAAFSLGKAGQHGEAIGMARQAAALAAQAGDVGEQAWALGLAAFSLGEAGQHGEAIALALEAFALARSIGERFTMGYAAITAIRAAAQVPAPGAGDAFATWVAEDEKTPQDEKEPDWRQWLEEFFVAATRACAWETLDKLLETYLDRLPSRYFFWPNVGAAIARVATAEGRAAGFESARSVLPRVVRLCSLRRNRNLSLNSALSDIVSAFARDCRDAGLIRDVAGLLTPELALDAPKLAFLLRVLAQVDEAKNPQAVLARMDPDIALWVRRIRDLPEPTEKPRRRRTRNG
ncbi:MAG: hypothetical protein P9F75_06550 [Candidatus Contendobacter sp.]|nr:hypothetical protein [Candidatus Contendobacter sp.]